MLLWIFIIAVIVFAFVAGLNSGGDKRKTSRSNFNERPYVDSEEFKMKVPKKLENSIHDEKIETWVGVKTDEALARYRHPELKEGESLKYSDPKKALEILLPLCDIEKGKYIKHVCLQCYRNLKDYDSEKKMIHRILDQIENVSPEDCDELEFKNLKASEATYLKRLNWVNTLIERRNKKAEIEKNKKKNN